MLLFQFLPGYFATVYINNSALLNEPGFFGSKPVLAPGKVFHPLFAYVFLSAAVRKHSLPFKFNFLRNKSLFSCATNHRFPAQQIPVFLRNKSLFSCATNPCFPAQQIPVFLRNKTPISCATKKIL
jgi:hypothetical protein